MIKNYFLSAYRNFKRNIVISLIHISGLAIGISAALVIFLIVYYEYSFDKFEPGQEKIFRVVLDANFNGTEGHSAAVPAPMGGAIANEITGVDLTVPVFQFPGDGKAKVSIALDKPENPVVYKNQKDIVFTNNEYFQLLPFKWITGSAKAALNNPFSIVLTESRARQYFPLLPLNAIPGRQITYNDDIHVTVSGIVKDLEENTLFSGQEFISLPTILNTNLKDRFMMTVWNDWMSYSQLYIKLAAGSSTQSIESKLKSMFAKYNMQEKNDNWKSITFHLQPLSDIHFNSKYLAFGQRVAQKSTLYGLLGVAAFLLLLGCINFINLSTAQASQRAKEIGVRKTMGSSKSQLIRQFLSETFFISSLATIVSVIITPLLLKVFSDFIPEGANVDLLKQPYIIVVLLLLTIVVSFLSGIYPAMILSGYNPVRALKNQAFEGSGETRTAWVRKGLTVSQFVIAQFFIIGTILVSKQIHYSLNKDLGFRKDAIITFETPFDTVRTHGAQLLNEINNIPGVELAATGFFSPAEAGVAFVNVKYKGKEDLKSNVQLRFGDTNYLKIYQIKLVAGRNVMQTDSFKEFIINETYAKQLGFADPDNAIGKQLKFNEKDVSIVGVMKDFHAESFHAPIGPVVFAGGNGTTFHIRLRPKDAEGKLWPAAIRKIEKAFKQIYPEADFNYVFLDDVLGRLYTAEQNLSHLLMWATALMIFISCLGLLGMVIYTTNKRTKEIGIRKILGASAANIIAILSKDFVQLVLLAFLIAVPLTWWFAYKWLENFAYRTSISWWIFALTAALILLFSLITLSIQTIRAAIANPVKSLRIE